MRRGWSFSALVLAVVLVAVPAHAATPGDDVLFGTNADQTILGDAGQDVIFGLRGDDRLFGEADSDVIVPGRGHDRVSVGLATTGSQRQTVFDDEGSDIIRLPDAMDQFTWVFAADGSSDVIVCNDPSDFEAEEELVFADPSDDTSGECTAVFVADYDGPPEEIEWYIDFGSKRDNRMVAPQKQSFLFGKAGNDRLTSANEFEDILIGGPGRDRMTATDGDVIVDGDGTGGDVISGTHSTTIFAADGASDSIDCGLGASSAIAYVDPQDTVTGCENVRVAE